MIGVLCAQIIKQRHQYKQIIAYIIIIISQVQISSNKLIHSPLNKRMYGTHLILVSFSCLNCSCTITEPLRLHVIVHFGTSTAMLTVSPALNFDPPSIFIYL